MNRVLLAFAALFFCAAPLLASAQIVGDCSSEPTLADRDDIVYCESMEEDSWWADNGYVRDGGLPPTPVAYAEQLQHTSIISGPECLSGKCLKVDTPLGNSGSLSIHWPLAAANLEPEELYMRYYFKIGPDWTAGSCDASGPVWPPGGKFWGLGDVRDNLDPGGQCGNGGAEGDGINCWSARGLFTGCTVLDGVNTCAATPGAKLRLGSYLYTPDNGTSHGANGIWDGIAERATLADDYSTACRRDNEDNRDPQCYCDATNNVYCGIGTGGQLVAERWYAIEMYIKMNTPGVADGIIRGWVDDVLSYEKTNVLFRKPGHDNLHVRAAWLNTYKGGVDGNCEDSELYYDQMVIATERIGGMDAGPRPNPPIDVSAVPSQ